jgi:hypothetical protein
MKYTGGKIVTNTSLAHIFVSVTLILKIICQCDVKHIITLPIKIITKASTYIITSITDYDIGLTAILVIMFVSTFKTDVILYVWHSWWFSYIMYYRNVH